jgi:two-component system, chemotaxis family, sensor kinase CheA
MFEAFEELRKDFVIDTLPLVHGVEELLLDVEKRLASNSSFEPELGELMRRLHTIKGNALMMGLQPLGGAVHRMEDLVKAVTGGAVPLAHETLDVLLDAVSSLAAAVQAVATEGAEAKAPPQILERITRLLESPPALPAPAASGEIQSVTGGPAASDAIRVDFRKLDHLLNLVGELGIFQTALGRTIGGLRRTMEAESWRELERQGESLRKTVRELQHAVMQARLLPAAHVFGRFPRLVRDLGRRVGKEVEVFVEGGDTEIDKTVLDAIGDPLAHLVRNSVDHGIETPAERRASGKPAVGRIVLSAAQAGKQIRIDVQDDGRGLDVERIAARARQIGVDVTGLEPRRMVDLIFLPGFSTAERVTELSGRGVGLSVVRQHIERLGGHLLVSSVPGQGACFSLFVPLTLAIIEALLLSVAGEDYALPISGVLETIRLDRRCLHRVGSATVLSWRGQTAPVLDLGRRLDIGRSALDGAGFAVAVFAAGRVVMLPVERLLGRQDLVIKGLDPVLGQTRGIAGATILGTGQVLLVLDVAALVQPDA